MIHIPLELTQDVLIPSLIISIGVGISAVFKQNLGFSLSIARPLIGLIFLAINIRRKYSTDHQNKRDRLKTQIHFLKKKAKGGTLGLG